MENTLRKKDIFEIEKCRVKIHNEIDLIDCLVLEQAHLCGNSLPFGYGYFCKHPRRKEFVEISEKMQSKLVSPPNVSQSDNQE
jgi:hypothetical protein